jgi:hypothetical protein
MPAWPKAIYQWHREGCARSPDWLKSARGGVLVLPRAGGDTEGVHRVETNLRLRSSCDNIHTFFAIISTQSRNLGRLHTGMITVHGAK